MFMTSVFTSFLLLTVAILRPAIAIGQTLDRIEAAKKEAR